MTSSSPVDITSPSKIIKASYRRLFFGDVIHRVPSQVLGRKMSSSKILNLWDMLKEYAVITNQLSTSLDYHIVRLHADLTREQAKFFGSFFKSQKCEIDQDEVTEINVYLPKFKEFAADLNLPITAITVNRIRDALEEGRYLKHQLVEDLTEMSHRLHDELSTRQFIFIEPKYAKYYRRPDLFGPEVSESFYSAVPDITDAGTALAIGLSTSCVMHLMRALETPIFLLATSLGHTPDKAAWGEILRDIRPLIAALPNSHPQQQILSEAAVQFRFCKNAWRDHAMHAKRSYSSDDAMVIYNAVKAFMESLAPHLHE